MSKERLIIDHLRLEITYRVGDIESIQVSAEQVDTARGGQPLRQ